MPDTTTVATANHPQSPARPPRHPRIADLPIRGTDAAYLRAALARGGRATNAHLAAEARVSVRTIQRARRRLEACPAVTQAGFRVTSRFDGRWQTSNQITLPPVADRRRCECMSGSESTAVPTCHPTYVREEQDQDQNTDQARERATTATTTATTTAVSPDRSTGRDPEPSCAPEPPPPTRRTPAKAQPATLRQLEYVAYLAGEAGISPPDASALTARSAHRAIRDLKIRLARVQGRELSAARHEALQRNSEAAMEWARERVGYAISARCDSCSEIHWAEPGGVCHGCRKPMRRSGITAAPDPDTARDGPSATSTPSGRDTTSATDPSP